MEAVADPARTAAEADGPVQFPQEPTDNGGPPKSSTELERPSEPAQQRFTFDVGGEEPTTTSVRLLGGAIPLEGELTKGETVTLQITCVVGEIAFVDERDNKTGEITGCERRHKVKIRGARRV